MAANKKVTITLTSEQKKTVEKIFGSSFDDVTFAEKKGGGFDVTFQVGTGGKSLDKVSGGVHQGCIWTAAS